METPAGAPATEIHPEWMAYLQHNQAIVEGWAEREWLAFLQRRNPAMPALSEKIRPPAARQALTAQTGFWNAVLAERSLPCLYTGERLAPGGFALDHFLPWAFVCHDQPWNLVPVRPAVNAAKGRCLPSAAYVPRLAELQAEAIAVLSEASGVGATRFRRATEPYVADLGLAEHELTDPRALEAAYHATVEPLLTLARRSGFPADCRYQD